MQNTLTALSQSASARTKHGLIESGQTQNKQRQDLQSLALQKRAPNTSSQQDSVQLRMARQQFGAGIIQSLLFSPMIRIIS